MAFSKTFRLPLTADNTPQWEHRLSRVLAALPRWRILTELAGEQEWLSVSHLASRAGVASAACSKHMLELRNCGLVEQGMGRLYRLLPVFRPAPGAEFLDLGVCLLRLRPASPAPVPPGALQTGISAPPA
ncbi:MAG: helix-turn-helix domain-containing protein [Verrucomicrobiota bacterium]